MTSRVTDDGNVTMPTARESSAVRRQVSLCKKIRPEFELVSSVVGGDVGVDTANVLLLLVQLDDPELLEELVAEGHSYDGFPNSLGVSTLYAATYLQAPNVFHWALEKGADPNQPDADGIRPLQIAAKQPQERFRSIKALISAGADVDAVYQGKWNPLVVAVQSGRFDNAELLLDAGADGELAKNLLGELARSTPSAEGRARILDALRKLESMLEHSESE